MNAKPTTTDGATAETSAQDLVDIEAMLVEQGRAWSDGDLDAWASHFTPDSDFITWGGIWWTSQAENLAGHQGMPDLIRAQLPAYKLIIADIEALAPTVALVHARWEWPAFIEDEDATPEDRCGLLTMVLLRTADGWKIRALQNTRTACT